MYDLVLRGGTVVEGTGAKPAVADVCIRDGRIAAMTDRFEGECRQEIDVSGKIVSPGFIDIHTHSDICPLLDAPFQAESKLFQGVTTEIAGNCGISVVPICAARREEMTDYFACNTELNLNGLTLDADSVSDYAERVSQKGYALHIGMLVGHGTLRGFVMGFDDRDPTPNEMEQLKATLDSELSRGAFGLSLGLIYPPSAFCKTEELVELAKVVRQHDAILTVHLRNEGPRVFEAVEEMLDIAQRSDVRLQISHLKLMGKSQWHRAGELLEKIGDARARGVRVTCDQYPYNATSTSLSALTPRWAQDGGTGKLLERLAGKDRRLLDAIAQEMENRGGPACVLVAGTHGYQPALEGKNMAQIAEQFGLSPEEAVAQVLTRCHGAVAAIYFSLNEEDVTEILRDRTIAIASDGYSFCYDPTVTRTVPHPRSFGTFPRFLRLNREQRLMPIEDAVYKMTGLPASILGLTDRGVLREGAMADVTVFDAERVTDRADFVRSVVKPEGIAYVLVHGVLALENHTQTQARAGSVLLHRK